MCAPKKRLTCFWCSSNTSSNPVAAPPWCLPDGTLFGEGVKTRIKEQLLAECNLHTIVRLPNGVFAPYTGIKTNLLFFTKGQPTQHVWYYEHPYPAGVKNYNKTKPIRIEEFDAEKAWWGTEADGFAARVENERAWKVSIEQIKAANYNLDQKNPHAADVCQPRPRATAGRLRPPASEKPRPCAMSSRKYWPNRWVAQR
jgi:type I restriction-modification system DNA methylase subunit